MEYLVVCGVALVLSGLTLFSGFGLGTILMPAFALFFPIPIAVAATAVVHLANNLFKVFLVGRRADVSVVARFALPASLAAVLGAFLLTAFGQWPALITYQVGGRIYEVTLLKLVIAVLIIFFAFFELLPRFQNLAFDRKYLPWGGLLSGFFGGLSGHQGALRSAFLIKAGLKKEVFIGTGTVSAVIVDIVRLAVYGVSFYAAKLGTIPAEMFGLVLAATLAAFLGAFLGARMMKKATLRTVQFIIGGLLTMVGLGMAVGIL
ncbi:MAG: sulfite exporter TauE/SafE family protein [Deltaproteobacteria bacterium]|nr:sulfite exporter TauE/SafE family protein [Deltaproteobacteria bacterium]